MNSGETTSELDSPKNNRAAHVEYWTERVAWMLGAGSILACLAGYLGPGPLGVRRLAAPNGDLALEYNAVERYEAPNELKISLGPSNDADPLRLEFDRSFTDRTTIEDITPLPAAAISHGQKLIYEFHASQISSESHVTYRYKHSDYGWQRYTIGIAGQPELTVTQLVLP
jgi:hypothetical protein